MIYDQTVSGSNANDYEFDSTFAINGGGGSYIEYFRASSGAESRVPDREKPVRGVSPQ